MENAMNIQRQAALMALASALVLGATTASFAQGATNRDARNYTPPSNGYSQYDSSYGNNNGNEYGPSNQW
jgi:hypothetical protein